MFHCLKAAQEAHETLTNDITGISARLEVLTADRKAANDRREAQRSQRVKATVEGTTFTDDGELGRLADQIAVFDVAVVELDRKLVILAEKQTGAAEVLKFADVEARLYGKVEEHVAAVEEIEAAARTMASGLKRAEEISQEMAKIRYELGVHSEFDIAHVRDRLSGGIGRALTAAGFRGGRVGNLSWTPEPGRPDENWAGEEREHLSRMIDGSMRSSTIKSPTASEQYRAQRELDAKASRYPAVADQK